MKENDVFLGCFDNVETSLFGSMVKVVLSEMRDPEDGEYIAYISDKVLYIAQNDCGEPLLPDMALSNYFVKCIV